MALVDCMVRIVEFEEIADGSRSCQILRRDGGMLVEALPDMERAGWRRGLSYMISDGRRSGKDGKE
jgi:hypothetical protein